MIQLHLDQDGVVVLLVVVTVMLEHQYAMVRSTLIPSRFLGLTNHLLTHFSHAANGPNPVTPSSVSYLPTTPGGQPMTPGTDLDVTSPDIGGMSLIFYFFIVGVLILLFCLVLSCLIRRAFGSHILYSTR